MACEIILGKPIKFYLLRFAEKRLQSLTNKTNNCVRIGGDNLLRFKSLKKAKTVKNYLNLLFIFSDRKIPAIYSEIRNNFSRKLDFTLNCSVDSTNI